MSAVSEDMSGEDTNLREREAECTSRRVGESEKTSCSVVAVVSSDTNISFPYKPGCGTVGGSENTTKQTQGGAIESYRCTIYLYSRLYSRKTEIAVDTTTDTAPRKLKRKTVPTQIVILKTINLLGYDALQSGSSSLTFLRKVLLPPSSGLKSKLNK
jgi:hypothetical protein